MAIVVNAALSMLTMRWINRSRHSHTEAACRAAAACMSQSAGPRCRRLWPHCWDAFKNKQLARAKPAAHMEIFLKDLAHPFGLVQA
jgi:hypothetical protein